MHVVGSEAPDIDGALDPRGQAAAARTSASGASQGAENSWRTRHDVVLWCAVLAPYVLITLLRVPDHWFPTQDQAVLELRLRDLMDGRPPLVGAFSRYGWSHPGPVWFLALAPFRALFGTSGVLVGSILWYGAGFATAVTLVRRRFGAAACVVALVACFLATSAAGGFAVLMVWNPHLALAWFPLLLVLCVSGAQGRPTDLAAAAFVGTALVQLHVGYVVLIGVPLLAAVVLLVRDRVRDGRWSSEPEGTSRTGVVAWIAATCVLWVPPVIEQLLHGRDGNLWKLASFFIGDSEATAPAAGWSFAAGVTGGAVRFPFVGLGSTGEDTDPFTGDVLPGSPWLLLPIVLLVGAAAVAAFTRGDRRSRRAVTVAATALAAGLLGMSQLVGERWPYLFVWRYVVAWFVVAVAVAVVGHTLLAGAAVRARTRRRRLTASLAVPLAVLAVTGVWTVVQVEHWSGSGFVARERAAEDLSRQLLSNGPPDEPVALVRFGGILSGLGDGVLAAVEDADWPVGVLPELAYKYGDHRVQDPDGDRVVWLVTEQSPDTTVAMLVDGARPLAVLTPLDEDDEQELRRLQAELFRTLLASGRPDLVPAVGSNLVEFVLHREGIEVDGAVIKRLVLLNEKVSASDTCRCAVIEVPAGTERSPAAALAEDVRFPVDSADGAASDAE